MNAIELTILFGLLPQQVEKDFVFPNDLPQQTTGLKGGLQNIHNFPWLYALAKNGNLRTYRIEVTNFHATHYSFFTFFSTSAQFSGSNCLSINALSSSTGIGFCCFATFFCSFAIVLFVFFSTYKNHATADTGTLCLSSFVRQCIC